MKEHNYRHTQKIFDEDNSGLENALKDDPKIINQLSDSKGYTLLMYASIIENLPAMEILLKNGADPNIVIPFEGLNDTPLSHAVATNNYEMVKLLFKFKANPNPAVGSSPLCDAMMLGEKIQSEK
ncbi:ankyrin repeat domain-containing protein [Chryseobacterium indoltheticum]|uniref:ankyrin repeat domain-containing protein n=1 Tax=Chryseobacterium indoltheticum TaxID=254 RepID=UPI003F492164